MYQIVVIKYCNRIKESRIDRREFFLKNQKKRRRNRHREQRYLNTMVNRTRSILYLFFSFISLLILFMFTITIGGIKSGIWQLDVIRNAQKRYRLTSLVLLFI